MCFLCNMEELEIRRALEVGMDGWGDWQQIWNHFFLGHLFKFTQDDNGFNHTTNNFSDRLSTHKQNTREYKYGHPKYCQSPPLKSINPPEQQEPLGPGHGVGCTQTVAISFLSDLSVMWKTKTLEHLSKRIQRSKGSTDKRLLRRESILRVSWEYPDSILAVSSCCCNERHVMCRSSARPMDPWSHMSWGWRTSATSAGSRHQLHAQQYGLLCFGYIMATISRWKKTKPLCERYRIRRRVRGFVFVSVLQGLYTDINIFTDKNKSMGEMKTCKFLGANMV